MDATARSEGPAALLRTQAPAIPPSSAWISCASFLTSCRMGRKPTAFAVRSGPAPASPRSSKRSSAFPTIRHVSRLLKELHWTPQLPIARAIQRDEQEIEQWRVEVWPRLKAEARREHRALVFVDESGFYLLPGNPLYYWL